MFLETVYVQGRSRSPRITSDELQVFLEKALPERFTIRTIDSTQSNEGKELINALSTDSPHWLWILSSGSTLPLAKYLSLLIDMQTQENTSVGFVRRIKASPLWYQEALTPSQTHDLTEVGVFLSPTGRKWALNNVNWDTVSWRISLNLALLGLTENTLQIEDVTELNRPETFTTIEHFYFFLELNRWRLKTASQPVGPRLQK